MRLPRKLSDCVMFAKWCAEQKQDPASIARLLVLAKRAKRAGESACNIADDGQRQKLYSKAITTFEQAAAQLGYSADWPGLWPVLQRNGYDVYLPEVS